MLNRRDEFVWSYSSSQNLVYDMLRTNSYCVYYFESSYSFSTYRAYSVSSSIDVAIGVFSVRYLESSTKVYNLAVYFIN